MIVRVFKKIIRGKNLRLRVFLKSPKKFLGVQEKYGKYFSNAIGIAIENFPLRVVGWLKFLHQGLIENFRARSG
ncbi:MAG: hypothetical protein Q7U51_07095 [Methanoregula sp.]|nr:hypothetical protein [Methanoregula sp.]